MTDATPYSDKLIEGSPKNSVSAVSIRTWQ